MPLLRFVLYPFPCPNIDGAFFHYMQNILGLILVKELVLVDENAGLTVKQLRLHELPFIRQGRRAGQGAWGGGRCQPGCKSKVCSLMYGQAGRVVLTQAAFMTFVATLTHPARTLVPCRSDIPMYDALKVGKLLSAAML